MKLFFIAGTDLSGSTVLDLALGSLPNIVGLGEIDNILTKEKRILGETTIGSVRELTCTCGQKGPECAIWGPTLDFIRDYPDADYAQKYTALVMAVLDNYPETVAIVDSSKQISALRKVATLAKTNQSWLEELLILSLWRGPISWLSSDDRRARRRNRLRTTQIRRRRLRKWATRYRELLYFTRRSGLGFAFLSLSAFQKKPNSIRFATESLLNLCVAEDYSVDISKTTSHILWGSHHRLDPSRSKAISRESRLGALEYLSALFIVLLSPAVISAYKELLFLSVSALTRSGHLISRPLEDHEER